MRIHYRKLLINSNLLMVAMVILAAMNMVFMRVMVLMVIMVVIVVLVMVTLTFLGESQIIILHTYIYILPVGHHQRRQEVLVHPGQVLHYGPPMPQIAKSSDHQDQLQDDAQFGAHHRQPQQQDHWQG